jgi:hypothetical protein
VLRLRSLPGALLVVLIASASAARAASPRIGDWETSGKASASFSIARAKHGWSLEDLVFTGAERCPSSGTSRVTFTLPQEVAVVKPTGRVSWSTKETVLTPSGHTVVVGRTSLHGMFTKRNLAKLVFSHSDYHPPGTPARTPGCRIPATGLTAHAARRFTVRDGGWTGRAANGEPVFFAVLGRGRAISSALPVANSPIPFVFVSFAFGRGCTRGAGGTTCTTTDPAKAGGGAVDPCLHGTSTNAMIGPRGSSSLGELQDFDLFSQFYGLGHGSATIHFTGPRTAHGAYSQPGDPSCTSTFTATNRVSG